MAMEVTTMESSSRNYDVLGRELFTPDEVRKLDNKKCIIFNHRSQMLQKVLTLLVEVLVLSL